MILIKNLKIEEAQGIIQDIDNIDHLEYLDLRGFNTLELTEFYLKSSSWRIGEPLAYDSNAGIVIIQFSLDSLAWFKDNLDILAKYGVSKEVAQSFCSKSTKELYCLDTF